MRKSFIFYASWLEAIESLPESVQSDALRAVVEYGIKGEISEQIKPISRAILNMAKGNIDANYKRYLNGCKGGSKDGVSNNPNGRRGKQELPKNYQETTKELPKNYQETTKELPNDNVDVDVDVDVNVLEKKPSNEGKKEGEGVPQPEISENYKTFLDWLEANAPYCQQNIAIPSEKEFEKLKAKYTGKEIADIILQIENRRDLRKRYTSLYRTLLNWLKNNYGERK